MMAPPGLSSGWRARMWGRALMALFGLACLAGCLVATPSFAQLLAFPPREKPIPRTAPSAGQEQMLVRAQEINYDYSNERVSAVGNVQLYYGASTLEADRVIYDQKTKRLHAEGNVRLTQPDGTVTNGEIMDLSDDFRDGFVDSLRADAPEQTRFAANRAERSGSNFTVFHSGVYTACEPCKDDPTKPPKWQVKAARIVHDQTEKMMYFESARLELAGVPFAYVPYFSAPDPTVKRKTGFLVPSYSTSSIYGFGVSVPYYFALAPDYDVTFTPMITSRQGPVLQGEWRQRLMDGSYTIRATGVFQLDKSVFPTTSDGYRDWRGSVESTGQFNLGPQWVWGWDGTVLSDKSFLYDYGLLNNLQAATLLKLVPDFVLSQAYIAGRGDRSYFEARAMYFYGLSSADVQGQLPIVHPVIDHDFVAKDPVLGGELEVRSNLTSLSRQTANFDPISTLALASNACGLTTADTALINRSNCLLRGVPGEYDRLSSEMSWRRTIVDPLGELWTPFVMVRGDENPDHSVTAQMIGGRTGEGSAGSGRGGFGGGGAGGGLGEQGKDYVAGEVRSIDAPKLTVLRTDNVTQTLELNEDTSLRRGRDSVTMADIHPGDHVIIRGASQNNLFVPKNVMVLFPEQWERMQQMRQGGAGNAGSAPPTNGGNGTSGSTGTGATA